MERVAVTLPDMPDCDYIDISTIPNVKDTKNILLEFNIEQGDQKEVTRITIDLVAACVSARLKRIIEDYARSRENLDGMCTVQVSAGKILIRFQTLTISQGNLESLHRFLVYHSFDKQFHRETFIDEFEEDPYELEQKRLRELPCYWDWMFICSVGGNNQLTPEKRRDFFELMNVAYVLEIKQLLELGSKYVARQVDIHDLRTTRQLLGLTALTPEEEERIHRENQAIARK